MFSIRSSRALLALPVVLAASCGDPPSAVPPGILVTDEDVPLVLTLGGTAAVSAEVTTPPQNGTLSATSGTLPLSVSYTPAANFNGADSLTFVVTAEDGTASEPIEVALTVRPVNDAPVITSTPGLTATEGQAYSTTITADDVDGGALTFRTLSRPGWLTLASATLSGTPGPDDVGSHDVVVEVEDADGATASQAFTITVADVNGTPTATALTLTTAEDTALPVGLSGADADGDTLTFVVATQPQHGTLSGTGGSLIYTPAADFHGADSFTYTAGDGRLTSAAATVSITVTPVNDAPVATPADVATAEDTAATLTLAGVDVDGDSLTFAVAEAPANGTLSGTPPSLTYTPNADFTGADRFTFTVSDGTLTSLAATVSVTVNAANDAPTAADLSVSTAEDTAVAVALVGADIDGDALSFAVVGQPQNGTLSGTGASLVYTPAANFNGVDSFTYTASDATATSAAATVTVTVTAVNDAPVATEADVTTAEDTASAITLAGTDVDGDILTFVVVDAPVNGTLAGTPPNLTYTPDADFNGTDRFTFTVNDGTATSAPATVRLAITPVNDAPRGEPATVTIEEDSDGADVAFVAVDPEDGLVRTEVLSQPENGTITAIDGGVRYVPAPDFNGADSFTWRPSDGQLSGEVVTVSITVTPVNDAPFVPPLILVTTDEDEAIDIDLGATDIDGDTLSFSIVEGPQEGSLDIVGGVARYTPRTDFNGIDTFRFVANDGTVDSDEGFVRITVTPVRDPALAVDDAFTVEANEALVVGVDALLANDSNPDGTATVSSVFGASNGVVRLAAGVVEFRPARDFVGDAGFRYTLRESNGAFTTANVAVTVIEERCGSGAVRGAEECDDGNTIDGDGCTAACRLEVCGDGIENVGEECDEGAGGNDGVACDPNCRLPGCGNGFPGIEEACDDGNTEDGDGCSALCVIEACGDSVTQAGIGEQCDDGANGDDADGCNDLCQTTFCGDGDLDGVETCDDGNLDDGDGCNSSCQIEVCGNGVIDANETCDDGVNDGTACDPNCIVPACGNGFVSASEECDDGNTIDADGCSAACVIDRCGDGEINAPKEQVTAVAFTMLARQCFGDRADTEVRFSLGSGPSFATNVPADCECLPGITTVRVTDPEILAGITEGDNLLTIQHANFVEFGWIAITIETTQNVLSGTLAEVQEGAGDQRLENVCELPLFAFPDNRAEGVIGLGFAPALEECDDGKNGDDTDGCDDTCRTVECGNGRLDTAIGEECDDGNDEANDGCTPTCELERCGDRVVQTVDEGPTELAESEPNDDGTPGTGGGFAGDDFDVNTTNGPLLQSALVTGRVDGAGDEDWYEIRNPTQAPFSVRAETFTGSVGACDFGDTVIAVRTAAGDVVVRNDDSFGFCSVLDFVVPAGQSLFIGVFAFGDSNPEPLPYFLRLQTGFVSNGEECDDGNDVGGDGCDPNCRLPACGNGFTGDDEECDDGNTVDNDGCSSTCTIERCGDGLIQPGAQPIAIAFAWTAENCGPEPAPVVFDIDGVAVLFEDPRCSCFDAFNRALVNDPAVLSAFADGAARIGVTFQTPPFSDARFGWATATLVFATQPDLELELANAVGPFFRRDDALCIDAGTSGIEQSVLASTGGEECDDGNDVDGDGCDTNCRLSGCGNGVTEPGEQCDDGNTLDNDGCSSFCLIEACGDGVVQASEGCDDGNTDDDDGCDSNCTPTGCGNGVITAGEACDDGNRNNDDACRNDCTANTCGDSQLDPGEECDDGNRDNGDGCSSTCRAGFSLTGIGLNVPEAELTGWRECFVDNYESFSPFDDVLLSCGGPELMIGCRELGAPSLSLVAHAPIEDVLFDTGLDPASTHEANGVAWYFNDQMSWGFAPPGVDVFKTNCDIADFFDPRAGGSDQRMCWEMGGRSLTPGFRCGTATPIGEGPPFERVVYTRD